MDYLIENEPGARIKVIGAGGCGGNAINHMIASGLQNVEFVAVNTDAQALRNNTASIQLQIGQTLTRGRGAGGNPEIGRKAALEDEERRASCWPRPKWYSLPQAWGVALELGLLRSLHG